MVTIGSFDAKTHLPSLLERVAKGEVIQITRRGVPIAKLVPLEEGKKMGPKKAAQEIRHLRKGISLGPMALRKLKEEGRA